MASSGAARPTMQRALQTVSSSSSSSSGSSSLSLSLSLARPSPAASLLLRHPHTQVRHATRATKAKAKAKAEALANPGAHAPTVKPKTVVRHHPNRDQSKQRGLSVIRQTGPREYLSVSGLPLPRPLSAAEFPAVKVDASHGLWDFFHSRDKPLNTPKEDKAHGRAWTIEELRRKKWEDLHSLWWVCIKERNRIATANTERKKGNYGYGVSESRDRELQVRKTQNAIKHALTERFYAWEDAVQLAKEDPEIEFTEDGGVVYTPRAEDWDEASSEWEEEDEDVFVNSEDMEADKEVKQDVVDPSLPQDAGKAQQDGPRP